MTLKAIKEALDLLAVHIKDNGPCDHDVNICSCGERQALADAKEQIAALEKAAKALDDDEVRRAIRHAPTEIHEAMELFATIAKEAE